LGVNGLSQKFSKGPTMRRITMLGAGLIADFYAAALHGHRRRDQIVNVYSRTTERAATLAAKWTIPRYSNDLQHAIRDPESDVVIVALPNDLHELAVVEAARAGKSVLCTKPLGRTAAEAKRMLKAVEDAGVFHAYLEDLVYTPKTLKALSAVKAGAVGKVLWVRSRETHSGPHSDWFWDKQRSGGGAIVDMGCHCIEIARTFIGKNIRPVEVICWGDTHVHPIEAEDHAVGMVRYQNGAIGQFEVSWTFRGGMDLRDEISGSQGTIWLNHWMRTGCEMYTATGQSGYVAEKAEGETGWLFPVGDEVAALGYVEMFTDALDALEQGRAPLETFYDGYVVNAIIDAAYQSIGSKRWEPIQIDDWRGDEESEELNETRDYDAEHLLIKQERLADGRNRVILRNRTTGQIVQRTLDCG
jgi:predicted dehydrogenase